MIPCKLNSSCHTHQISAVQHNIYYLKPSCLLILTDRYTLHLHTSLLCWGFRKWGVREEVPNGSFWQSQLLPGSPTPPGYLYFPQEQRTPHTTSCSAGKVAASTRGKHNQAASWQATQNSSLFRYLLLTANFKKYSVITDDVCFYIRTF